MRCLSNIFLHQKPVFWLREASSFGTGTVTCVKRPGAGMEEVGMAHREVWSRIHARQEVACSLLFTSLYFLTMDEAMPCKSSELDPNKVLPCLVSVSFLRDRNSLYSVLNTMELSVLCTKYHEVKFTWLPLAAIWLKINVAVACQRSLLKSWNCSEFIQEMEVSLNGGIPKSLIQVGFSMTNHHFWDSTIYGNLHMS